ncbi:MAG TPA: hypothetical protein VKX24_12990 [Acidimicrobiia bacterium]|nr:hypothetical protein [Acidimicrobiia bacterium]
MAFRRFPSRGLRRCSTILTVLLLATACAPSGSGRTARQTGAAEAPSAAPATAAVEQGSWRHIAEPPIPPAGGMATAWTGHQLVVWGGGSGGGGNWQSSNAGAAYDPAADRWEALPPAPVPGRIGASAVWTGREILFWGGQTAADAIFADGAAYDPEAKRWRTLPPAPIGPRTQHQAVWTGREMVVWGGYARCCPIDSVVHDPAAAAYDPATNRWRRIADVPPPWSGDDGYAATVAADGRPLVWRRGRLGAYDPAADRWSEVPGAPAAATPPASPAAATIDPVVLAAFAGGDVFTWIGNAGRLDGAAWRPSAGTWRRTAPLDAQTGSTIVAGPPDRLFAAAGQSARILEYRIADDRWSELPLPPIPTRSDATVLWTGSELVVWGGMGDEGPEMDGAAWRCCTAP